MKRLIFNPKKGLSEWKDFIPLLHNDFGLSCVQKKKYLTDKVRINNQEVSTGNNRTALYTMPGGVDNGVRYSPLYETSGLDITEIKSVENQLKNAKSNVEKAIKDEVKKTLDSEDLKNNVPKANTANKNNSNNSTSSE